MQQEAGSILYVEEALGWAPWHLHLPAQQPLGHGDCHHLYPCDQKPSRLPCSFLAPPPLAAGVPVWSSGPKQG